MITPLYGQLGVIKLGGTKPVPELPNIAGLQLWLDAADATTLYDATSGGNLVSTDGATVARWQDKSGNNRHATQSTANARPLLKTAVLNSKSVVRFDGSNDFLSVASNSGLNFGTSDFSVFICTRILRTSNNATGILSKDSFAGTSTYKGFLVNRFDAAGGYGVETRNKVSGVGPSANARWNESNILTNTGYIFGPQRDGRVCSFFVNGLQRSSATEASAVDLTNTAALTIAALNSFSIGQFANLDITEILIYNTALTTAQRQGVESYLNAKWAIY